MTNEKRREVFAILAIVEKTPGWTVKQGRRSGHVKCVGPTGTVGSGTTPSDRRSIKNFQAALRRHGLETDPRRMTG